MDMNSDALLFSGRSVARGRVIARVSAEQANWRYLNLVVLHLVQGQTFDLTIADNEYVAVVLSGVCNIRTNRENFEQVGRRENVFTGLPYAIYLPRNTEFTIEAISPTVEIASCWAPTTQDHKMRLITPVDVQLDVKGGGNATYQTCSIIKPDTVSHRLSVFEAYTPGGNWSFFPPNRLVASDNIDAEVALLHKQAKPAGYTLQQIYDSNSDADVTIKATNNDISIVPNGYWTMTCPPGHTAYNLCVIAGDQSTYSVKEDQSYSWFTSVMPPKDVRLPIVDHGMEPSDRKS